MVLLKRELAARGMTEVHYGESCAAGAGYPFHVDPVDAFDWLKRVEPVARVGASVRVYYVGGGERCQGARSRSRTRGRNRDAVR